MVLDQQVKEKCHVMAFELVQLLSEQIVEVLGSVYGDT